MADIKKSRSGFTPEKYVLEYIPADGGKRIGKLVVYGTRFGPPNLRFVINQKNLKIENVKIIWKQKNKEVEHTIARVNHLPSFEEVRLHTASALYPGRYEITLNFTPYNEQGLRQLANSDLADIALRELLPSFDNREARANAILEIID